jgi:hypothetical protein
MITRRRLLEATSSGAAFAAFGSRLATWLSRRAQARAGQLAREILQRDELYKDFIVAASQAYGQAIVSNEPQIQESSPSTA